MVDTINVSISNRLGRQIEEMWSRSGEKYFTVLVYRAGEGLLGYDILRYLQSVCKRYGRLHYCIIEKSAALREKQQKRYSSKSFTVIAEVMAR
ncbi:MAG: SAM-dependent methyltransferase [Niastella sp.]|nr:SAM-dependent methyltransferase [Niastella sp.]